MSTKSGKKQAAEKPPPPPEWPKKSEPSEAQQAEMTNVNARRRVRRPALPVTTRVGPDGKPQVGSSTTDEKLYFERLLDATGTRSDEWMNRLVQRLSNTTGAKDPALCAEALAEGLGFLNGVGPRDELEAALGAQMYAMYRMGMAATQFAAAAQHMDKYRDYSNVAVKASRTFVAQVEALAKLRSGGKQTVEVRYVYIDARGGQNIIGSDVTGGGGLGARTLEQPHGHEALARPAAADGLSLRGQDATRHIVPGPGAEGSEAMLPARGPEPRSADRLGERQLPDGPLDARDAGGAGPDAAARQGGEA